MSLQRPNFPIRLPCQWLQRGKLSLPTTLSSWLYDESSLTARLKKQCTTFRVELLGQSLGFCEANEVFDGITTTDSVVIREVILYCDEKPQVFARSLLPVSSLTGEDKQLAELGTQPLGQVLFNDPNLTRDAFEIANFNEHSTVAQLAQSLNLPLQPMWGRRSLFRLNNKPLSVAEVFLPHSFAYLP